MLFKALNTIEVWKSDKKASVYIRQTAATDVNQVWTEWNPGSTSWLTNIDFIYHRFKIMKCAPEILPIVTHIILSCYTKLSYTINNYNE